VEKIELSFIVIPLAFILVFSMRKVLQRGKGRIRPLPAFATCFSYRTDWLASQKHTTGVIVWV
jgi:hypothetical protein